ncbi:MAG TPA: DUF4167 domain-containing protein [Methylocella sp.]|nr:DUF4167 domain-containing protein [Methylocella sp.]
MRPAQNNKRMRGRPNNNRKGSNALSRSYESSGPDVKIRGTAHHIGEKYLQLARDAQTSGDPVMAENYLQHAEHYFRIIAAAQQAHQQGLANYSRSPGEPIAEENEEDGAFAGLSDRFASPSERFFPSAQPNYLSQSQPGPAQPPERSSHEYSDRQPSDRPGQPRPERSGRPERPFQERSYRDREQQSYPEKFGMDQRNGRGRDRDNRISHGRGASDYTSESQIRLDPAGEKGLPEAGMASSTLPAFITGPVRALPESHESAPPNEPLASNLAGPDDAEDTDGFHRPRRRRRAKTVGPRLDDAQNVAANADDSMQD